MPQGGQSSGSLKREESEGLRACRCHPVANAVVRLTHTPARRGMIVFKLERERPAFSVHQNVLYYVKDRYLRTYDFNTQRDNPLISIRRGGGAGTNTVRASARPPRRPAPRLHRTAVQRADQSGALVADALAAAAAAAAGVVVLVNDTQGPKTMAYNPAENALLITSDVDGGSYELYMIPKESARGDTAPVSASPAPTPTMPSPPACQPAHRLCAAARSVPLRAFGTPALRSDDRARHAWLLPRAANLGAQEAKRGLGVSAVFIARNRFAVLDKASNTLQIRNLQNEITKKCPPPCATTDAVFYAGTGMLLCRSEDKASPQPPAAPLRSPPHTPHRQAAHIWAPKRSPPKRSLGPARSRFERRGSACVGPADVLLRGWWWLPCWRR